MPTETPARMTPIESSQRVLIEDLLTDYAHCIDDREYHRWPELFTEDATYQVISRESHEAGLPIGVMLCAGRGMMRDRVHALEKANLYEPHTYCHVLSRARMESNGSFRFQVRSNFLVNRTIQGAGSELFAAGKYLDQVTIERDRALLRERRVILESRQIDILLVFPL